MSPSFMGNLISLLFSNTSLLISLASPAPITNTTNFPRGPYLSPDFADPAVFKTDDGRWYAYATRHPQNPQWNVPMGISEDFGEWRYSVDEGGSESDAMPILPAWVNVANAAVWAPDIAHWNNDTYTLLFSASLADSPGRHCVGLATSASPTGPFTSDSPTPFICPLDLGGAIDGSFFADTVTGRYYVLYKVDGNSFSTARARPDTCTNSVAPIYPTPIMLQEVDSSTFEFVAEPQLLLDHDGEAVGDCGTIEGPSMMRGADGVYVLFFSAGCFIDGSYRVEYATRGNLDGPFARQGTLLQTGSPVTGATLSAPGSLCVVEDGEHAVFHAGPRNSSGSFREMWTVSINVAKGFVTLS